MPRFANEKTKAENLSQCTQLGCREAKGRRLFAHYQNPRVLPPGPCQPQHTHICLHIDFARFQSLVLPYNATGEKAQASSQVSIVISLNLGKRG